MVARFSAPVQTGPRARPASCTMGTGSFLGVKRPGRDVNHPHPSSAEVKERVALYLYSPSRPAWPLIGRNLFNIIPSHLRLGLSSGLFTSGFLIKTLFVSESLSAVLSLTAGVVTCGNGDDPISAISHILCAEC